MIGRVLFLIAVNTAFFVAVLWYMPLAGILEARGYSPDRILAVMNAAQPEGSDDNGDEASDDDADEAGTDSAAEKVENGDGADDATQDADRDSERPEAIAPDADEAPTGDDQSEEESASANEQPAKLVATDNINVRGGRGTDAQLVGRVSEGDTVDVLTPAEDDWVEIDYSDGTGWAYRPLFEAP